MVQMVGFEEGEELSIRHLMDRFRESNFRLNGLRQIQKANLPGHEGKVVPKLRRGGRLETKMFLSSCGPFTVAHELAHVSDIAVRRRESLDNLSCQMAPHWHLAYKMSSEYYANRVACAYSSGDDCFRAFKSDAAGLLGAAHKTDWGSFLIYYSLLLGILHGVGKFDMEPLQMVAPTSELPERVSTGIDAFKGQAISFFEGYADLAPPVAAAA